jgi:hypothetical protein
MHHFFSRLGFVHGKMLHYQKEITGTQRNFRQKLIIAQDALGYQKVNR